ncbi:MAG: hypothetical protein K9I68_00235 [Bacteroidales bacterium]|nr:hypothetical protein [Bacteroidales bacterium]MCF8336406.1 hypothetical protein [Bacteroidales bacterium]
MKNLTLIFTVIFIATQLTISCNSNDSEQSDDSEQSEKKETIDGTYTYSGNTAELVITINGDSWQGKTTIAGNTEYQKGIVKGEDLYNETGSVKIGYVNGESLTTSIGGQRVTLHKK